MARTKSFSAASFYIGARRSDPRSKKIPEKLLDRKDDSGIGLDGRGEGERGIGKNIFELKGRRKIKAKPKRNFFLLVLGTQNQRREKRPNWL